VTTLIETVRKRRRAPLRRYAELRRSCLGLKEIPPVRRLHPDLRSDKTYDFDASKDLVLASVAPLGRGIRRQVPQVDVGRQARRLRERRQALGRLQRRRLRRRAYVLMNYNDTMDALFTFAHEAGHAMHSVLSSDEQPFATSQYTIFVAEVASTTNERFLLEHLLAKTTDPRERFLLLQHAVDEIVGTFYTQVLFADFELQAHRLAEKGQPITPTC
jgi:oligoendopeptidase F